MPSDNHDDASISGAGVDYLLDIIEVILCLDETARNDAAAHNQPRPIDWGWNLRACEKRLLERRRYQEARWVRQLAKEIVREGDVVPVLKRLLAKDAER